MVLIQYYISMSIALIIVGIILIVVGYVVTPLPSWAKSLLIALGAICLIVGIILFVLPYVTSGGLFITPLLT
jgi:hypothetical protein